MILPWLRYNQTAALSGDVTRRIETVFQILILALTLTTAVNGQATESKDAGASEDFVTNSIGMKFKLTSAGGSRQADSRYHKARITKSFYLGVTEVTQEQYEKIMGENPSWFSKNGIGANRGEGFDTSNFPVENVSWEDAVEFCKKLSAKEGVTYRLPTEAEWEYACRAGSTTRYCFGNGESKLGDYAWYQDNSNSRTRPVGTKKPNAWGVHDMHGNVSEWCQDWFKADYYAESPTEDGPGPSTGLYRVIRGGSWYINARRCQSAARYMHVPSDHYDDLGFRVARNPPDSNSLAVGAAVGQDVPEKQSEDVATKSAAAEVQRFPDGVLSNSRLLWYSKHLAAMNERSLKEQTGQKSSESKREAYRFIWLRSFDHPVAVRLENNSDQYRLVAKQLDGKGGYAPGMLMIHKPKVLTREEWLELMRWINECSFWTMTTTEKNYYTDESGLRVSWAINDGAQWIVEGVRDGKYHIVDRQSPDCMVEHRDVEKYRGMCLHILSLAGFNLDDEDIY
jgi:formylglycine-generating enzyme required for sulfatase activity